MVGIAEDELADILQIVSCHPDVRGTPEAIQAFASFKRNIEQIQQLDLHLLMIALLPTIAACVISDKKKRKATPFGLKQKHFDLVLRCLGPTPGPDDGCGIPDCDEPACVALPHCYLILDGGNYIVNVTSDQCDGPWRCFQHTHVPCKKDEHQDEKVCAALMTVCITRPQRADLILVCL
jgi:hypothetical protein